MRLKVIGIGKCLFRAFLVALPVSLIMTLLHQNPSLAALKICNRTSRPISVAVAYPMSQRIDCCGQPENVEYDPNALVCYKGCFWSWISKGWWNLNVGECQTPLGRDLRYAKAVYIHASSKGRGGHGHKASFCVRTQAFTINHWGRPLQCRQIPRVRKEYFRRLEVRGRRNIILNITPASKKE
ncbi:MAG: DUF1036 domain-containing protein [Calothrix sp. MO_167.B12]|nr:DUF1036 domain-containing protein [Calothrix sp. MO_167.B12]